VLLRLSDLDGGVLTIERSLSAGVLGPTKSGRTRRVTLGSGTAGMIGRHAQEWAEPEQDWLSSASPRRPAPMTAGALSRRLAGLGQGAGVEHAALHRLRHGVATYLDHGLLLKAQARPGHRDPATTLSHYSHATRSMTPTRQTGSTASSTAWTPGTPRRKSSCFTVCPAAHEAGQSLLRSVVVSQLRNQTFRAQPSMALLMGAQTGRAAAR
jgi:Phage integrase family